MCDSSLLPPLCRLGTSKPQTGSALACTQTEAVTSDRPCITAKRPHCLPGVAPVRTDPDTGNLEYQGLCPLNFAFSTRTDLSMLCNSPGSHFLTKCRTHAVVGFSGREHNHAFEMWLFSRVSLGGVMNHGS